MGVVHRFIGSEGRFDWEGVQEKEGLDGPGVVGVSGKILVGPQEGAPNFRIRYFRIEPGGHSSLERHPHDHGVFVLHGRGLARMGENVFEVGPRDVVYVPGGELHQFSALDEPFGFLCVVPPKHNEVTDGKR